MRAEVLRIAAAVECFAGLAFSLIPAFIVSLLLGIEPGSAAVLVARVTGLALLSLGIACWGAGTDSGSPAQTATFRAITVYNAGVAGLLITFGVTGQAHGVFLWFSAIVHVLLAGALVSSRAPKRAT